MAQRIAHLSLYGESFVGKFRGEEGEVQQLGLLDPSTVQVELVGGTPFYGVARPRDGTYAVLTEADIVHVRGLSIDGIRGLSPVRAARETIAYSQTLTRRSACAFVRQGARPSGVLTVPAGPGQDELLEALKEQFESRHGGPDGTGRVAVLSGDVSLLSR